jgi:hypothetical protein
MPARTFDHKYSAPRSAKSTGELAFKLARDDDKENGAAKGQALSPSKIIKGVRGRAVGTPISRSVDWPHAVCGHSASSFSSSSGPAPAELASSLDSLAQIANIQVRCSRPPRCLLSLPLRICRPISSKRSCLFAKRCAFSYAMFHRLTTRSLRSQHTRRLAAIEMQYYDDVAGAADEESQPAAPASRAHTGGTAAEASSGRPVSASAAGRKADGLVRWILPRTRVWLAHPPLVPSPTVSCLCQSSSVLCLAAPPSICARPHRTAPSSHLRCHIQRRRRHPRPPLLQRRGRAPLRQLERARVVSPALRAQPPFASVCSQGEHPPRVSTTCRRQSRACPLRSPYPRRRPSSPAKPRRRNASRTGARAARSATSLSPHRSRYRRFEAEMLQRQRDEEAHHRFVIRPLPVPTSTMEPRFQLLQDNNKRRSESIKRDSVEKLKASQVVAL